MPALPHTKTFPGKVRIVDPGPKDPRTGKTPALVVREVLDPRFDLKHPKQKALVNKKFRGGTVTKVTVPAGYDLAYDLQHKAHPISTKRPERAVAHLKVVKDGEPTAAARLAMHAELAHEHQVEAQEVTVGHTKDERGNRIPGSLQVETRKLLSVTAKSTHPEHEGVTGKGEDAAAAVKDLEAQIAKRLETPKAGAAIVGDEGDGEGTGLVPSEPDPTEG